MNNYEFDGVQDVPLDSLENQQPCKWDDNLRPEEWREMLLELLNQPLEGDTGAAWKELEEEAKASFSDGINTGFYINAYTCH